VTIPEGSNPLKVTISLGRFHPNDNCTSESEVDQPRQQSRRR
jgi:hypothetical protein